MRLLDRMTALVRSLFQSDRIDADLADEMRFHVERETEANIARGMTPRAASAAAALLAFLCVEASWDGARQAMSSERWAEQLGRALLPVVRSTDGIVIAVGEDDPTLRWGSTLTGKSTQSWRDDDARRVWVMARSTARRVFGARPGCRLPETIDFDAEIRGIRRSGRLRSVLWVAPAGDRVAPFEPYCLAAPSP